MQNGFVKEVDLLKRLVSCE